MFSNFDRQGLNDMQRDFFAQVLLHHQVPHIIGLYSTLLQHQKPSCPLEFQIIHGHGNHWIVCSLLHFPGKLMYKTRCLTLQIIAQLQWFKICWGKSLWVFEKQVGGLDCGMFAIAIVTSLAFDVPPQNRQFDKLLMRHHIVDCFQKTCMTTFP